MRPIPMLKKAHKTWEFVKSLAEKMGEDEVSYSAAAIAFYAWLSIFPLLLAAVSAFGVWLGVEGAKDKMLDILAQNLPVLKMSKIDFAKGLESVKAASGVTGIIAFVGLLWTGMQVVLALQTALTRVFAVKVQLNWLACRLRALAFVVISSVLIGVSMGSTVVLSLLPYARAAQAANWLLGIVLSAAVFAAAYRVLPRLELAWRFAFLGGLATSVMWFLANLGLQLYFSRMDHLDKVYGSFAGVVLIMLVCYYLSFVTLFGAEITSVLIDRYGRPEEKEKASHPV